MFVPFNEFTRNKFKNLRQELKDKHGNETNHRIAYLDLNGFGSWLDEMRGDKLTPLQLDSLVYTYQIYGKREDDAFPDLLQNLNDMHEIEIPFEDGMDTAQYWTDKFQSDYELAQ